MAIYVASGIPRTVCRLCWFLWVPQGQSSFFYFSQTDRYLGARQIVATLQPPYAYIAGWFGLAWSYHRLAAELGWAIIIWETYWPLQSTSTSGLRHSYIHSFDNTVMEFCTVCGGCGWET